MLRPGFNTTTRNFAVLRFFKPQLRVRRNTLRLYRRRVKELAGTLGIKDHPDLPNFYPKFNKKHLSEELRELVPVIPEDQKPVHVVKVLFRGIGYRCTLREENINGKDVKQILLRLGYPFEILLNIPDNVTVENGDIKANASKWTWITEKISPTDCQEIVMRSKCLQTVTQFAANIKKHRPPEPYKLKGIYVDVNNGKKRTHFFKKKRAKS